MDSRTSFCCSVAKLCPTLCDPMDCSTPGSSVLHYLPGKNTKVSCHFFLWGIFLTQGLNPCLLCLLHWQADSVPLRHLRSPINVISVMWQPSLFTWNYHTIVNWLYWNIKDWRRQRQPTPVFLPGESHGQRNLGGYNPWGRKELDMIEQLTHTI